MLLKDINPFVRYVRNFTICKGFSSTEKFVRTRDNRLFFVVDGEGSICTEDSEYRLCRHTLVLVHAGEKYRINPKDKLSMIVVNYDYTSDFSSFSQSFHPFSMDFPGVLENITLEDAPLLYASAVFRDGGRFEDRLRSMLADYFDKGDLRDAFLSATMKSIIIDVVGWQSRALHTRSGSSRLVGEVVKYLRENYAERVENETLSEHFHFTSVYVNRVFKKEMGVSVHQYLISLRISIAKELLDTGEYTPTETALLVGFEDYPHFSKTFKRIVGKSPMQYAKSRSGIS